MIDSNVLINVFFSDPPNGEKEKKLLKIGEEDTYFSALIISQHRYTLTENWSK